MKAWLAPCSSQDNSEGSCQLQSCPWDHLNPMAMGRQSYCLHSSTGHSLINKLLVYKSSSQPVSQGTWPETVLNFIGHQGNANLNHHVAKMANIKMLAIQSVDEDEKLWGCNWCKYFVKLALSARVKNTDTLWLRNSTFGYIPKWNVSLYSPKDLYKNSHSSNLQ